MTSHEAQFNETTKITRYTIKTVVEFEAFQVPDIQQLMDEINQLRKHYPTAPVKEIK